MVGEVRVEMSDPGGLGRHAHADSLAEAMSTAPTGVGKGQGNGGLDLVFSPGIVQRPSMQPLPGFRKRGSTAVDRPGLQVFEPAVRGRLVV